VRGLRLLLSMMLAAAAIPAAALGATRYAAPAGGSTAGCPQSDPCSLPAAVEGAAANDEVIVTPGNYSLTDRVEPQSGISLSIHGEAGEPRPTIVAGHGLPVFRSFTRQSFSDLRLESDESLEGTLDDLASGAVFDDLELFNRGQGAMALRTGPDFTLTDSLLSVVGNRTAGLLTEGAGSATPSQLYNDTIVAEGAETIGMVVRGPPLNEPITVDATNVIVDGATDVRTEKQEVLGGEVTVMLDHSNLDTHSGNGTFAVTDSQTAPPVFVDAAGGNYQEALGSPTIDAGVNSEADGTTDLAGNPRELPGFLTCEAPPPAIVDIGAYEFVPTVPPCAPLPSNEPEQTRSGGGTTSEGGTTGGGTTGGPGGPKAMAKVVITSETVLGDRAVFRFKAAGGSASGFSCKLDGKKWRRCKSPATYLHLRPGHHVFHVRPTSGGSVDGPAVKRKFRIAMG
jgi:hypothetical protein